MVTPLLWRVGLRRLTHAKIGVLSLKQGFTRDREVIQSVDVMMSNMLSQSIFHV